MNTKPFIVLTVLEGQNKSLSSERRVHVDNIGWYENLSFDNQQQSTVQLRTGEKIVVNHSANDIDVKILNLHY